MTANLFVPREKADVAALVEAYPLCWVVSAGLDEQGATPLPLLVERNADGGIAALFGHFALSNPQVDLLRQTPRAMILAMGPNGYIAPRLVSNPTWGPTWNYAVARFDVEVAFVPDENDAALRRLVAFVERDAAEPWTVKRMGPRYADLSRYIIAFRATVLAEHPRFKLGQDENQATRAEIVDGLGDRRLADWMVWANRNSE